MNRLFLAVVLALLIAVVVANGVYLVPSEYGGAEWDGSCGSCTPSSPCVIPGARVVMASACDLIFEAGSHNGSLWVSYSGSDPIHVSSTGPVTTSNQWRFALPNARLVFDFFSSSVFYGILNTECLSFSIANSTLNFANGASSPLMSFTAISNFTLLNSFIYAEQSGSIIRFNTHVDVSIVRSTFMALNGGVVLEAPQARSTFSASHSHLAGIRPLTGFMSHVVEDSSIRNDLPMFRGISSSLAPSVKIHRSVFTENSTVDSWLLDYARYFSSVEFVDVTGFVGRGLVAGAYLDSLLIERTIIRSSFSGPGTYAFSVHASRRKIVGDRIAVTIVDSSFTDTVSQHGYVQLLSPAEFPTDLVFVNSSINTRVPWAMRGDTWFKNPMSLRNIHVGKSSTFSGEAVELSETVYANETPGGVFLNTTKAVINSGVSTNAVVTVLPSTSLVYRVTNPARGFSVTDLVASSFSLDWPSSVPLPSIGAKYPLAKSSGGVIPFEDLNGEFNVSVSFLNGQTFFSFNPVACNPQCILSHISACISTLRCACLSGWTGPLCDVAVTTPVPQAVPTQVPVASSPNVPYPPLSSPSEVYTPSSPPSGYPTPFSVPAASPSEIDPPIVYPPYYSSPSVVYPTPPAPQPLDYPVTGCPPVPLSEFRNPQLVSTITFRMGDYVDGVSINNGTLVGGQGGNEYTTVLDSDDYIINFSVFNDNPSSGNGYVNNIKFKTFKGKIFGVDGRGIRRDYTATPGQGMTSFYAVTGKPWSTYYLLLWFEPIWGSITVSHSQPPMDFNSDNLCGGSPALSLSPVALPTTPVASPQAPPPTASPTTPPVSPPTVPSVAPPQAHPVSPIMPPVISPPAPVTPPAAPYAQPTTVYPPTAPVYPPVAPVAPPTAPVSPPVAPVAPPTAPVTPPVAPPKAPVSPPVAPVAPPTAPVYPPLAPVVPPNAPVTPPVAPVAPPTAPVSPPIAPVVPPTAPVLPPQALPVPVAPPIVPALPPPAPVTPPVAPVSPPQLSPNSPIPPPITSPVAPVVPPTATVPPRAPMSPPSAPAATPTAPVAPPVAPPISPPAPVSPPTAPVSPPTAPVTPPVFPVAPTLAPVYPPFAPVAPPTTIPVSPPVAPVTPPTAPVVPPTAPALPPTVPVASPVAPISPNSPPIISPPVVVPVTSPAFDDTPYPEAPDYFSVFLTNYSAREWNGECGVCVPSSPCRPKPGLTVMIRACTIVMNEGIYGGYYHLAYYGTGLIKLRSVGSHGIGMDSLWTITMPYATFNLDAVGINPFYGFTQSSIKTLSITRTSLNTQTGALLSVAQISRFEIRQSTIQGGDGIIEFSSPIDFQMSQTIFTAKINMQTAAGSTFNATEVSLAGLRLTAGFTSYSVSIASIKNDLALFAGSPTPSGAPTLKIHRTSFREDSVVALDTWLLLPWQFFKTVEFVDVSGFVGRGLIAANFMDSLTMLRCDLRSRFTSLDTYLISIRGPTTQATGASVNLTIIDSMFSDPISEHGYFQLLNPVQFPTDLTFINSSINTHLPWAFGGHTRLHHPMSIGDRIHLGSDVTFSGEAVELHGDFSTPDSSRSNIYLETNTATVNSGLFTNSIVTVSSYTTLVYRAIVPSVGFTVGDLAADSFALEWPYELPLPSVGSKYPLARSSRGVVPYNNLNGEFNVSVSWQNSQSYFSFEAVLCNPQCVASHVSELGCVSRFRCSCAPGWSGAMCELASPTWPPFVFVNPPINTSCSDQPGQQEPVGLIPNPAILRSLDLRAGAYIDAVYLPNGSYVGGVGGNPFQVRLAADEHIVGAAVVQSEYVHSLAFNTSKGRSLPLIGDAYPLAGSTIYYRAPQSWYGMVGFEATTAAWAGPYHVLSSFVPIWAEAWIADLPAPIPPPPMYEVSNPQLVKQMNVRFGYYVDGVHVDNGTLVGGDGGVLHSYTLQANDFVNEVIVFRGEYMDGLVFNTNKSRSYGRNGGAPRYVFKAPSGFGLIGFNATIGQPIDFGRPILKSFEPIWGALTAFTCQTPASPVVVPVSPPISVPVQPPPVAPPQACSPVPLTEVRNPQLVSTITFRTGDYVDGVSINNGTLVGGQGGLEHTTVMDSDDYINEFTVTSDNPSSGDGYVNSIAFKTFKGKTYGVYGTRGTSRVYSAAPGQGMISFSALTGKPWNTFTILKSFEPIWGPITVPQSQSPVTFNSDNSCGGSPPSPVYVPASSPVASSPVSPPTAQPMHTPLLELPIEVRNPNLISTLSLSTTTDLASYSGWSFIQGVAADGVRVGSQDSITWTAVLVSEDYITSVLVFNDPYVRSLVFKTHQDQTYSHQPLNSTATQQYYAPSQQGMIGFNATFLQPPGYTNPILSSFQPFWGPITVPVTSVAPFPSSSASTTPNSAPSALQTSSLWLVVFTSLAFAFLAL